MSCARRRPGAAGCENIWKWSFDDQRRPRPLPRTADDPSGVAVNVLALPDTPPVADLASVGVRRVSTGGALCRAAYAAAMDGAQELLDAGTSTYAAGGAGARIAAAFAAAGPAV